MSLNEIAQQFTPGAAGVWTGVLMFAVYMIREWRETRKLSSEDRQARREGYAKQVESLQDENRQLRVDIVGLEERHENYRRLCHQETDQLRDHIVVLENRLAGIMRKMADVAIRAARGDIDSEMAALILQIASESEPKLKGRQ